MKSEKILIKVDYEKPDGFVVKNNILHGEIEGLQVVSCYIKGEGEIKDTTPSGFYDVLIFLSGEALLEIKGKQYEFDSMVIARIPYNESYIVKIKNGENLSFIRLRKCMNDEDLNLISQNRQNHSSVYIKAIAECPVYTEDIKSSTTLSRMLLPVGLVPRFCAGLVETEGPDEVGEHDHPMLDQLFLGLDGCKCTCIADGERLILTENMMLHIPLGSTHSVSVEPGDKLSYIWLDYFLSHDGEKYISEQHQMEEE